MISDRIGGPVLFGLPPFDQKVERFMALLELLRDRLSLIERIDLDYSDEAFVRIGSLEKRIIARKGR